MERSDIADEDRRIPGKERFDERMEGIERAEPENDRDLAKDGGGAGGAGAMRCGAEVGGE